MSTSAARIAANKANAQRSTGPRTTEGKARVCENAYKHGLRSTRNPLELSSETALDFEREAFATTLAGFLGDLAPIGTLETQLVERLAQINLRLNRAARLETTHLEMAFAETVADARAAGSSLATDDAFILTLSFLRKPEALKLISQYESRLSRDFARTLTQLRQAQKLRANNDDQKLRHNPMSNHGEIPTKQTQHPTLSRVRERPVAESSTTTLQLPAKQTQPTGQEPGASASAAPQELDNSGDESAQMVAD